MDLVRQGAVPHLAALPVCLVEPYASLPEK